jgi:hypothetical protein
MTLSKKCSRLLLSWVLVGGVVASAHAAGEKYALLIGVDKCEAIGELKVCAADALALKSLLEQIGYDHITVLVDNHSMINALPTIGNVERAIKNLAQVAEADDKILFFFSGHGVTYNGTSFIVPTDGDQTKGVSLTWVKDQFAACKAKEKVMILDVCHSGAAKGVSGITPDLKTAGSLVMLLSCEKDQVSWPDKQGRHSVFTSAVLEGLSGKAANADRKVTHRALAEYVRKSVKGWAYENQKSEQTPVLVANAAGDIILSDIALMKPARVTINNVTVPAPAIAPPVAVKNPTPPTAVAGVEDAHAHVYYTGSSLGARLSQDPSQFKESPQRFSVKDGNHVADAMLNKTWVLYDTNEILNLSDARSRAEQMGARLPTPQELASLLTLKRQKDDWSRVNGSVFPEHKRTSLFWTGSGTRSSLTTLRQVVDFSDGSLRKASSDDQYGVLLIVDK